MRRIAAGLAWARQFSADRLRHPLAPAAWLAMLAGALLLQLAPLLPPAPLWAAAVLTAALLWRWPLSRWLALMLIGAAWVGWRSDLALRQRLPVALEGADLDLRLRLIGLPERRGEAMRFDAYVLDARRDGAALAFRGRIRLAWYGAAPPLRPCAQWQLRARLKRPRGAVNPGGLDMERQALQLGLVATGYVRDEAMPRETRVDDFCVDAWRQRIADAIDARIGDARLAALLRALAVGDQRGFDEEHWQVLRATGVGHLVAISGFHVGMLALATAFCVRRLWRLWPSAVLAVPGVLLEAPFALAAATIYSALAGFGVATQRTLLMLAAVALARGLRRNLGAPQALTLALGAILFADPFAILSAGFWLSFVGVALLVHVARDGPPRAWWRELAPAQFAMSVGLLPLGVWLFA